MVAGWNGGGARSHAAADPSQMQVFRAKGVLDVAGSEVLHTLQAVHATFELSATPIEWGSAGACDVPRETRLVFIGRHLPRAVLAAALRACRSEDAPD